MVYKDMILELAKYIHHNTLDTQIYDRVRLWRIPNSIHEGSGLYKIPITIDELNNLSLEEIKEMAQKPRTVKRMQPYAIQRAVSKYQQVQGNLIINPEIKKPRNPIKETPPCIVFLLEEGTCIQGNRNNTAAALASFFRQAGKDEKETLETLNAWNQERCNPPLPGKELITTIISAFRSPKTWGCNSFASLSVCSADNCKLRKTLPQNKPATINANGGPKRGTRGLRH